MPLDLQKPCIISQRESTLQTNATHTASSPQWNIPSCHTPPPPTSISLCILLSVQYKPPSTHRSTQKPLMLCFICASQTWLVVIDTQDRWLVIGRLAVWGWESWVIRHRHVNENDACHSRKWQLMGSVYMKVRDREGEREKEINCVFSSAWMCHGKERRKGDKKEGGIVKEVRKDKRSWERLKEQPAKMLHSSCYTEILLCTGNLNRRAKVKIKKKKEVRRNFKELTEIELAAHGMKLNEIVQVLPVLTESHDTQPWSSSNSFDISKHIWRCVWA